MATTSTRTTTYPRFDLIKMQILVILHRAGISQSSREAIEKGLAEQWIYRISIYALDVAKMCHAELRLEIDWNEFNRQMSSGKITVAVDNKWKNGIAIETIATSDLFFKYVNEYSLATDWSVTYTSAISNNSDRHAEVNKALGFQNAEKMQWASSQISAINKIPELSEFSVGLYLRQ